jgi:hypothetical protein
MTNDPLPKEISRAKTRLYGFCGLPPGDCRIAYLGRAGKRQGTAALQNLAEFCRSSLRREHPNLDSPLAFWWIYMDAYGWIRRPEIEDDDENEDEHDLIGKMNASGLFELFDQPAGFA